MPNYGSKRGRKKGDGGDMIKNELISTASLELVCDLNSMVEYDYNGGE